ncbi:MAG: GAF domain-containing protein [Bacteroidetes bacterium]|nr:MAG: GAF domain-containing protein [Bacteroidota bacterium]
MAGAVVPDARVVPDAVGAYLGDGTASPGQAVVSTSDRTQAVPRTDPTIATEDADGMLAALEAVNRLLMEAAFDLPRLLQEIVRITAEHMRVRGAALRLLDADTGALVLEATHGLGPAFTASAHARDSDLWQLLSSGEDVEILDVREHPELFPAAAVRDAGVRSVLEGGLFRKGRLLGTLSVFTDETHTFTPAERHLLRLLAGQAALGIELARLHQERLAHQRLRQELLLAAEVQARMLPRRVPDVPGVSVAAWSRPWQEVGGDFYDLLELPGRGLGLAIGDVSGKGLPAALLMAAVRTALRSQAEHLCWLPEMFRRVNQTLLPATEAWQFATLFYGVFDPLTRTFAYVNAGHNPPLVIRTGETLRLEAGGIPVGLLPDAAYETATVRLREGDLLVLYTDGFTDVVCEGDEVFGEERLCRTLHAHAGKDPEAVIAAVQAAMEEAGCGGDDRTIVVMKVHPPDAQTQNHVSNPP